MYHETSTLVPVSAPGYSPITMTGAKPTTMRGTSWTFLTNHAHVLICLQRDPTMRLRDIAGAVGITERAVHRILGELEEAGYISRDREGRRNHYEVHRDRSLRHPLEAHHDLSSLLALAEPAVARKAARQR